MSHSKSPRLLWKRIVFLAWEFAIFLLAVLLVCPEANGCTSCKEGEEIEISAAAYAYGAHLSATGAYNSLPETNINILGIVDFDPLKVEVGKPFEIDLTYSGWDTTEDPRFNGADIYFSVPPCFEIKVESNGETLEEIRVLDPDDPGDNFYNLMEFNYGDTPRPTYYSFKRTHINEEYDYIEIHTNDSATTTQLKRRLKFTLGSESDEEGGEPQTSSFRSTFFLGSGQAGSVIWYTDDIASTTDVDSVDFVYDASTPGGNFAEDTGHKQLRLGTTGEVIDVTTYTGSMFIRFYPSNQVGSMANGFYSVSGTPARRAEIAQQGGNTVSYRLYSGAELKGEWELSEGSSPQSYSIKNLESGKTDKKIKGTETNGDRYEIDEVWEEVSGQGNQLVSSVKRVYHIYSVDEDNDPNTPAVTFEKLVASIDDPDGVALTTSYAYGTNPALASYQKQVSAQYPDGSWEYRQYDGLQTGEAEVRWRPFLNEPLPSGQPGSGNFVKEVEYLPEMNGGVTSTMRKTFINGHLISQQRTSRSGDVTFFGVSGLVATTTERWASPGGTPRASTVYRYGDDEGTYRAGRVFATVAEDLASVKYEYQKGTYNVSAGTFQANESGTDLQTTATRGGVASSGNQSPCDICFHRYGVN